MRRVFSLSCSLTAGVLGRDEEAPLPHYGCQGVYSLLTDDLWEWALIVSLQLSA